MDPATVIVVLAAHLLCSGGLLYLIARRLPPRGGIGLWSAGLVLFGGAYLARLTFSLDAAEPWVLLLDTVMVAAALLFIAGLLDFTGRTALALSHGAAALLAFMVVEFVAITEAGAIGRHAVLNLTLGALYAALAVSAATARRRVEAPLHLPLLVVCGLMAVLAALTGLRAGLIAQGGVERAHAGLPAQVYYAYASLAAVLLAMSLLWMVFERLNGQLSELASRDSLTRALNRKGLDDALRRHFGSRGALPMVLLAIDVDHFKAINDSQGHATGDLVLRAIAAALARQVRGGDLVARVGGEEFAVCCPAADKATVVALAERLREAIGALVTIASSGRNTVHCTVSIGVSRPFSSLADWAMASTEADAALYAAKAGGRNRVMTS
jgi:diguanylate cyclase (GGDEF)-like protein